MAHDRGAQIFRLLTIHNLIWSLAMSLAGGFVAAYLLHMGFSVPQTLCIYVVLLATRLALRLLLLPLIRRLGLKQSLLIGAAISACQFLPLINAERRIWLIAWIVIVSIGECIYWPIFHAATACFGGNGRRGRQIAARQMCNTTIGLAGPMAGALLLNRIGPAAEFGVASLLCLSALGPLLFIGQFDLGTIPTARASLSAADRVSLKAFAADGWMSAGGGIAWPIILFTSLGGSFAAFAWASSAASLAGSLAGLGCGVAIDRGHREQLLPIITTALLATIVLRASAGWLPWAALTANAMGAAAGGIYCPMLMSAIYDRARDSGSAYRFHLAIEAGWDVGAMAGCLAAALVVLTGVQASLAVLPSVLGVVMLRCCVRAGSQQPRATPLRGPAVQRPDDLRQLAEATAALQ